MNRGFRCSSNSSRKPGPVHPGGILNSELFLRRHNSLCLLSKKTGGKGKGRGKGKGKGKGKARGKNPPASQPFEFFSFQFSEVPRVDEAPSSEETLHKGSGCLMQIPIAHVLSQSVRYGAQVHWQWTRRSAIRRLRRCGGTVLI